MYLFWFTHSGREAIREMRRLEKAQNARNKGDKTAMERLWREYLVRAEASGSPLERANALSDLGSELMNQDRYGEAETLLRQAQELARAVEGPAGFWSLGGLLASVYRGYAKLLRTRGDDDTAALYEERFEKSMKKIDPKGVMPRDWLDQ